MKRKIILGISAAAVLLTFLYFILILLEFPFAWIPPSVFPRTLWIDRALDVFAVAIIMLSGVIGVIALVER